ncbi:hypothetical protein Z517_08754 [Fonsecaea pedrosoi CBS 271.37]|uniref:CoA carboxyltransferase C-terminal domain-containing protein n=1 Tax=Fonsecaea pedrosoi CBS 271.37 TaxID=1442368 RepID=A0A0D2GK59_9EURO|nr:uncharacterized protein Z517_08754 [Fonsecaea pedrosoi CBS 271.37]KIW78915.1 hypothetical protein Z517_08754 [Fonsecaea pedrosoi CBS 271.37]
MGSKKSTLSAPSSGADGSSKGRVSSTTINDPVYAQPASAPSQPSVAGGTATGKSSGTGPRKDDPVYSQVSVVGGNREGQPARQGQINDPVYGQPQAASSTSNSPAPGPGQGKISAADDPVYSQSRGARGGTVSDPVYAQPVSALASPSPPVQGLQAGRVQTPDDPVFSQSQPLGATTTAATDPVYGQTQTISSTAQNPPSRSNGTGQTPPSDDPVFSQPQSGSTASSRLNQLTSQISPAPSEPQANTKRARKSKSSDPSSDLPADYSDILTHLKTMRTIATTPDTSSRGYIRQKTAGKLWSRERIATLLDPDTWREVGSVTGTVTWEKDTRNPQSEHVRGFIPSNNPQGFGRVTCPRTGIKRQIYLTSDDFSIRSGHADGSVGLKTLYGEKLALRLKVPVVKLVDGSSGGGSVSTIMTQGYSYMPHVTVMSTVVKQLNMGIPNIGAVVGPAIGLGAARVVATHFSVMAGDIGSLFNAGPKVVEGATFEEGLSLSDLGGPAVHCTNGTIDNLARNEAECFDQIRTVLAYLPACGQFQAPPTIPADDPVDREDLALRSIIPRKKSRMYNPYTIILSVVDRGSWFEIGALWGRTGITGLARLGGRPVGILSLNCEVNSGALDAMGSQKLMKMIKFCDVFNLPIVQFVDVPGYAIGTVAERTATMKWGVELGKAYYSTTTPIFSVVTRRVYGVAGGIMLDSREPWMRIAWPSGNWGSLPLDGGIEVGHRHELKTIREKEGEEGWKRRYKELEDEYVRLMNPVRTAACFNVEEIVDPKDTRKICCRWTREMYGLPMQERLADRASGKIHAVFT